MVSLSNKIEAGKALGSTETILNDNNVYQLINSLNLIEFSI